MGFAEGKARLAVVLGGTGFVGRRIVCHLLRRGFKVRTASRNHEVARRMFRPETVEIVRADVRDEASLIAAFSHTADVVNAVSLYVERGGQTFDAIHVEAAARVAQVARRMGAHQLVHISGIGSDPNSKSDYIRARGRGESAVREAFPGATLVRPTVMVGPDDAFLSTIMHLVRVLPLYPLFGAGTTRLQPVHVEDVGEAVAQVLDKQRGGTCYELGGPRTYLYRDLVKAIAQQISAQTLPVPMPFGLWRLLARLAELVPGVPLTRTQVDLMRRDNVVGSGMPGFAQLEIEPRAIEDVFGELHG